MSDNSTLSKKQEAHGLKRAAQVSTLIAQVTALMSVGKKDQAAHKLTHGLYELGGVYVKYLQMGATLVPKFPGMSDELKAKIFDQVTHPNLDIHSVLFSELGADYPAQIKNVSGIPIAAGSFAGVYEATHEDGTAVIVKALRPNLKKQLRTDLRLLGTLTRSTQPFFRTDLVDLVAMYKEFKTTVWRETDYINEAENASSLEQMYSDKPEVFIPHTYKELCTERVIIQERLYGIPLSELVAKKLTGQKAKDYVKKLLNSDLSTQLEILVSNHAISTMEGPFIHGDPHPGNIYLLSDNRIGMIDFGVRLDRVKSPHSLYQVWKNEHLMSIGQDVDISDHAARMFRLYNEPVFLSIDRISKELESRGVNLDIARELRNVIESILEPSLPKIREHYRNNGGIPASVILEAVNDNNQFAIKADETIARIARTNALIWESFRNLGLSREVSRGAHERIQKVIKQHPEKLGDLPKEPTLSEASEIFLGWYSELVERNPLVFGPLFAKMRTTLNNYKTVDTIDPTVSGA